MINLTSSSISQNQRLKKVYNLGQKKVVSIDDSIVKKLDISEETNTFLQQEITEDGTGILMKVRRLEDFLNDYNT